MDFLLSFVSLFCSSGMRQFPLECDGNRGISAEHTDPEFRYKKKSAGLLSSHSPNQYTKPQTCTWYQMEGVHSLCLENTSDQLCDAAEILHCKRILYMQACSVRGCLYSYGLRGVSLWVIDFHLCAHPTNPPTTTTSASVHHPDHSQGQVSLSLLFVGVLK